MVLTRMGVKFRRRQMMANRRAEFYRTGKDIFNYNAFQIDEAAPFPPLQNRQQLQHGFVPPRDQNTYNPIDLRVRQAASLSDLGNDVSVRQMRIRINRIARNTMRAGVRFRRMLSFGGMGVTCLFEVKNAQNRYNKCVVKMARPGCEEELLSEKKVMQTLKGAPHIVQIKTARELRGLPNGYDSEPVNGVMPQEPPNRPRVADMQDVDRDSSILMMEYLSMSTLGYWSGLLDHHAITVPDDALWRMLACLVGGCVAMAYPPKYQEHNMDGHPAVEYVPSDAELRQNKRSQKVCNFVHFDLDPSNILVDDFDDGDHASVPRLKIADFGATAKADASFYRSKQRLWGERFSGKVGYMMPEQWTAEWDLVEGNPLCSEPLCTIAGLYGEKSNIWQIGMVMLTLITQMGPEFPPYARRVQIPRVRADDVLHRYNLAQNRFIVTHGYLLDDPSFDNNVGRELRNVVMACLAYLPSSRPTLANLVEICDLNVSSANANPQWGSLLFSNNHVPPEKDLKNAYNDLDGAVPEDDEEESSNSSGDDNNSDGHSNSDSNNDSDSDSDSDDDDDGDVNGDGGHRVIRAGRRQLIF